MANRILAKVHAEKLWVQAIEKARKAKTTTEVWPEAGRGSQGSIECTAKVDQLELEEGFFSEP